MSNSWTKATNPTQALLTIAELGRGDELSDDTLFMPRSSSSTELDYPLPLSLLTPRHDVIMSTSRKGFFCVSRETLDSRSLGLGTSTEWNPELIEATPPAVA